MGYEPKRKYTDAFIAEVWRVYLTFKCLGYTTLRQWTQQTADQLQIPKAVIDYVVHTYRPQLPFRAEGEMYVRQPYEGAVQREQRLHSGRGRRDPEVGPQSP